MYPTVKVPYGFNVSVTFFQKGVNTHVKIICPSYVVNERVMAHCYSDEYTIEEILKDRDFHRHLKNLFGKMRSQDHD